MEDDYKPDRLELLERWLHSPPTTEFPIHERIQLLNDMAGAALEIRDLRIRIETLTAKPKTKTIGGR